MPNRHVVPARLPRGRVVAAASVLVATLALSGCSGSAGASSSASDGATVQTVYGKVKVPAHPTRIVALDFPEATALADLGIKPVGDGGYIPALPAYTSFFAGVPNDTDSAGNPDLEKIASQKPDLILDDEFTSDKAKNKSLYEQLSRIAPTVVLVWTQAAGNWRAEARGTAQAVGRTAQMSRLESSYLDRAAAIKKRYAKVLANHTVALVSGQEGEPWYLYGPDSSHGRVLAEAGARFGAGRDQKAGFAAYSPERFGLLEKTDIIIVDSAGGEAVTSSPVFAALPAAKAGHVYTTDYFFPSSYRIANALLDDFAAALRKTQ